MSVPVEIGAIRFSAAPFQEGRRFVSLVNPSKPIESNEYVQHNLSDAEVAGQPSLREVLPRLTGFLQQPETVGLAYKAHFAVEVLGLSYLRAQLDPPNIPIVDVAKLAKDRLSDIDVERRQHELGIKSTGSLRARCAALDLISLDELGAPHRAERGAELCRMLFLALIDDEHPLLARSRTRMLTCGDLFTRSSKSRKPRVHHFTDAPYATSVPVSYGHLRAAVDDRRSIALVLRGSQPREERTCEVIPLWFSDPDRSSAAKDECQYLICQDPVSGVEHEVPLSEVESLHLLNDA
jgi:DNA polymerase III epsilon subunit-like protein